jgi:hypothetical protein
LLNLLEHLVSVRLYLVPIVEVILLKFTDGVLEGLNWSVLVMVVVGRKFAVMVCAIDTVALRSAQSASLETLTVTFLAPRLLATACSGLNLQNLRSSRSVADVLEGLRTGARAHTSRNTLDNLISTSQ